MIASLNKSTRKSFLVVWYLASTVKAMSASLNKSTRKSFLVVRYLACTVEQLSALLNLKLRMEFLLQIQNIIMHIKVLKYYTSMEIITRYRLTHYGIMIRHYKGRFVCCHHMLTQPWYLGVTASYTMIKHAIRMN